MVVVVNEEILVKQHERFVISPLLSFFFACTGSTSAICTPAKSKEIKNSRVSCDVDLCEIKTSCVVAAVIKWVRTGRSQFYEVHAFFALP